METSNLFFKPGFVSVRSDERQRKLGAQTSIAQLADSNHNIDSNSSLQSAIHELKNPLAAVRSANDLLLREIEMDAALSPKLAMLLDLSRRNISKIELQLQNLLAGNEPNATEFSVLDLALLLNESIDKVSDRLELDRVQIFKSFSTGNFIRGNATQLVYAFENVLVNALDALTDDGKIWVAAYRSKTGYLKVIFNDNGIGIDEATLTHIFDERFTMKVSGNGFGLFQVKSIMKQHRGTVEAMSIEGIGTSLVFSFPTDYD